MNAFPEVQERPTGRIPTTDVTNEIARAVQALRPAMQSGQVEDPVIALSLTPLKIAAAAGFAAYTGVVGVKVTTALTNPMNITVANLATFGATNDAFIINPEEAGMSTNRLTLSSAAAKIFYGFPDGRMVGNLRVFILVTGRGAACT